MNKQSKKTKKHHANIHAKVQRMSALNYDTEVKVRLKKKKLKNHYFGPEVLMANQSFLFDIKYIATGVPTQNVATEYRF